MQRDPWPAWSAVAPDGACPAAAAAAAATSPPPACSLLQVIRDPDDPEVAGSYYTAVVKKAPRDGRVLVEYDEVSWVLRGARRGARLTWLRVLLPLPAIPVCSRTSRALPLPRPCPQLREDDDTRSREAVPVGRVRPLCPDDSASVPLSRYVPGDAVDCWALDGWWEVRACACRGIACQALEREAWRRLAPRCLGAAPRRCACQWCCISHSAPSQALPWCRATCTRCTTTNSLFTFLVRACRGTGAGCSWPGCRQAAAAMHACGATLDPSTSLHPSGPPAGTDEEYTVHPPARPPDPQEYRVRSGKDWVRGAWAARARSAYPGSGNFRTPAAAGPSSSSEDEPLMVRRASQAAGRGTGAGAKLTAKPAKPAPAKPAAMAAGRGAGAGAAPAAKPAKPAPAKPAAKAAAAGSSSGSEDEPLISLLNKASPAKPHAAAPAAPTPPPPPPPLAKPRRSGTAKRPVAPTDSCATWGWKSVAGS